MKESDDETASRGHVSSASLQVSSPLQFDNMARNDVLVLFDVDGTLTPARNRITSEVERFLFNELMPRCNVGLVGGSDLVKIAEQMGESEDDVVGKFDFVFAENGLVAYKRGKLAEKQNLQAFVGEEKLQRIINFCLHYMSKLELPVKRGTFIEFRNGMINICPPGRSVTQNERNQFVEYDLQHGVRERFRKVLSEAFPEMDMSFVIGGQISIDVFPVGWDKRYCLRHVENEGFKQIHFFGDKTNEGENDFEIFSDPRTVGHTVTSPEDTVEQLRKLFNI
jgi:phosphomannomutase